LEFRVDHLQLETRNYSNQVYDLVGQTLFALDDVKCRRPRSYRPLPDGMVAVEGENMRQGAQVVIDEVKSGDWGTGGDPLTTNNVKVLAVGKPKGGRRFSAADAAEPDRSTSALIDERLSALHAFSDAVLTCFGGIVEW